MSNTAPDQRPETQSANHIDRLRRIFTPKVLVILALALVGTVVVFGAYIVITALNEGMTIPDLLREYGYWLILGWTFVEGETVVIIAGVAASAGHMDLWGIIAVAWIGSYCGDQLYFTVGKKFGPDLLKKFPWGQKPVDRASRMLLKYDYWFILSFRFIYGVRNVTPPALAIAGVSHKRFAILNFVAAGLWAFSFAGAGYLFGQAFKSVVEDAHEYFGMVIVGLFVLAVTWALYHTIRGIIHRKRAYRAEQAAQAEAAKKPKASKRPAAETGQ